MINEALHNEKLSGAINCGSPNPVTNLEFSKKLVEKLQTVEIFKVPKPLLGLALGESSSALTSSQKMVPAKLNEINFPFHYPTNRCGFRSNL
jgi:NAD dependent epimerase/dehydratase family enzyme